MVSPENIKLLEELPRTQFGVALIEFLNDEKGKIEDLKTINSLDELAGRKHALELISKLFAFMGETKVTGRKSNPYE